MGCYVGLDLHQFQEPGQPQLGCLHRQQRHQASQGRGYRYLSNDKVKGKGNSKNGNKYLCWAFVEAANKMRRYCPQAKAYFIRKPIKSNCKALATKALAYKIARACFYDMRDQVPFDVVKIFGPAALPQKAASINQVRD